jgi:hypothetical protein
MPAEDYAAACFYKSEEYEAMRGKLMLTLALIKEGNDLDGVNFTARGLEGLIGAGTQKQRRAKRARAIKVVLEEQYSQWEENSGEVDPTPIALLYGKVARKSKSEAYHLALQDQLEVSTFRQEDEEQDDEDQLAADDMLMLPSKPEPAFPREMKRRTLSQSHLTSPMRQPRRRCVTSLRRFNSVAATAC